MKSIDKQIKDKVPEFAAAKLIDQLTWAIDEGDSEAQIHELAWQLVDATRPKTNNVQQKKGESK
tara:strand:- start:817 stop:1008 length:192 start_codon:yes stop_codon:yes gene_type:complete